MKLSWRRLAPIPLVAILLASIAVLPAAITNSVARAAQGAVGPVEGNPDLLSLPGTDWLTSGGNLYNERYSQLDQITTHNVQNLAGAWVTHLHSGLGVKYSQEATPLIEDGVMYVPTGNDDVFALNAATGALLWEYKAHLNQKITTVCCGWDNRGVAVGDGLVFVGQLDGSLVALNQRTGLPVWRTQVAPWQDGYTITAAPRYYQGVVYTGISGGEFGGRGRLTALDARTGRILWRFYTIPGPGDFGGNTWPAHSNAYLHGGATIWNTPAIDPRLGLIYFSTSNAAPDYDGSVRPGDNLFTASIVALHMNGKLAWYFQEVHHDIWDLDAPSPVVLFDTVIHGKLRHALGQVGKTGWVYLLDRTNGKPLIGIKEKPVPQDPAQATAPTQPYPVGDTTIPQCAAPVPNFPRTACIFQPFGTFATVFQPVFEGGTVQSPMAYDPQTGYLYVTGDIWPGALARESQPQTFVPGQLYVGAGAVTTLLGAKFGGTLSAVNTHTNRIVWQIETPYVLGIGSGTLATAGGVVFVGHPDGTLRAYNARTGAQLWQWQTGAGADAPAITYDVNGVQYVAIAAGGNSLAQSANGDAVWAFRLKGPLNGMRLAQAATPPPPPHVVGFTSPLVATNVLDMVDFGFSTAYFNSPTRLHTTSNRIVVPVGTSITWINTGTQPHTATSNLPVSAGGWNTGLVQPGGKASVVMTKVGTFNYFCIPHPWMIGQIVVIPKGAPYPKGTIVLPQA
jgi:quinohemoprotein ethanol dehydrogenase